MEKWRSERERGERRGQEECWVTERWSGTGEEQRRGVKWSGVERGKVRTRRKALMDGQKGGSEGGEGRVHMHSGHRAREDYDE